MVTVLSPHFDDAVLSCWHVLAGQRDVSVVNIFTGPSEDGEALSWWDTLTRASDPDARLRERLEEDRRALATVGVEPVDLDLPEELYRPNGGAPPPVLDRLRQVLREPAVLYAPADIGYRHGDHGLVRAAALELRAEGFQVRLYADLPHANLYGLPAWVTGHERPYLDVDAYWRRCLEQGRINPAALQPEVHELDDQQFARKLEAVNEYRTQVPALERMGPLEELRYEVVWSFRENGS